MLKYGDGSQCLTVTSLDVGAIATLSGCQTGGLYAKGHQDWYLNLTDSTIRPASPSSSDSALCLAWGNIPPSSGRFVVDASAAGRRQRIEGFGYEIQSDSIGSDNRGLPNSTSSVPHDLTGPEKARFFEQITKGFRWCRLALGLFLRGLDPSREHVVGRWPTQMQELLQMQTASGLEGFEVEYWSPAPAWKNNGVYIGGSLAGFNYSFLDVFGDAVVYDLEYLRQNGLNVSWWGLQNEPNFESSIVHPSQCKQGTEARRSMDREQSRGQSSDPILGSTYSTCSYSQCQYYDAFKAVAPKVKKAFPQARIHANSARGQMGASPIALDPEVLPFVDGWTWHFVGQSSDRVFGAEGRGLLQLSQGRPVFENEFEYYPGGIHGNFSTINTAQMLMNWLTFANAPTFYWIHASKPCQNIESLGYGLSLWKGPNATGTLCEGLQEGEFVVDPFNANAMLPFTRLVPWDSWRLDVLEDTERRDQRVLAWETPGGGRGGPWHAGVTPGGKVGVALTNRNRLVPFTTELSFADRYPRTLRAWGFSAEAFNTSLGEVTVPCNVTVDPLQLVMLTEY